MVKETEDRHETPAAAQLTPEYSTAESALYDDAQQEQEGESQIRRIQHKAEMFMGSPPPSLLQKYESIQPDFPERILRLTKQEAEYRRMIANQDLDYRRHETFVGQVFGLIIAIGGFVWAGYFAYLGYPVAATFIGGGTLTALVTVFVRGRNHHNMQRQQEPPDD